MQITFVQQGLMTWKTSSITLRYGIFLNYFNNQK